MTKLIQMRAFWSASPPSKGRMLFARDVCAIAHIIKKMVSVKDAERNGRRLSHPREEIAILLTIKGIAIAL